MRFQRKKYKGKKESKAKEEIKARKRKERQSQTPPSLSGVGLSKTTKVRLIDRKRPWKNSIGDIFTDHLDVFQLVHLESLEKSRMLIKPREKKE